MASEQVGAPAPVDEAARRQRGRSTRSVGLVLVLVGFAALLYAMTLVRLIG